MVVMDYRHWGEKFDERMDIRRKVMDILGIALPKKIDKETQEEIKQSMIGCATCTHIRSCAAWVGRGDGSDGPPTFCPNRATFLRLMNEAG